MIILGTQWPKVLPISGIQLTAHKGIVTYQSVGVASDVLLQRLDELYGTDLHPKAMRAEIKFTGISLRGQPADLAQGITKIKLFYETDSPDDYAELFTNIDLRNGVLEINEKDEGYRREIVHALTAH